MLVLLANVLMSEFGVKTVCITLVPQYTCPLLCTRPNLHSGEHSIQLSQANPGHKNL